MKQFVKDGTEKKYWFNMINYLCWNEILMWHMKKSDQELKSYVNFYIK